MYPNIHHSTIFNSKDTETTEMFADGWIKQAVHIHNGTLCLVAQLCLALWDLMDCSPLDSSVHRIFQARILQWVATSFSRGPSLPRNWTGISGIASAFFTSWATREVTTMEYYSAIKRNEFESVLMRWMNLQPIIQSEVSQKEKNKHRILTHVYGI